MGLTSGKVRLVLGKLLRALHSFPEIIETHNHTLQSTKCDGVYLLLYESTTCSMARRSSTASSTSGILDLSSRW